VEDSDVVVILRNEDGDDVEFELIGTVEHDGEEYFILLPLDDRYMDEGLMILRAESDVDSGDSIYMTVENNVTQERVLEAYKEQLLRRVPLCKLPLSWLLRPDPVIRYFD